MSRRRRRRYTGMEWGRPTTEPLLARLPALSPTWLRLQVLGAVVVFAIVYGCHVLPYGPVGQADCWVRYLLTEDYVYPTLQGQAAAVAAWEGSAGVRPGTGGGSGGDGRPGGQGAAGSPAGSTTVDAASSGTDGTTFYSGEDLPSLQQRSLILPVAGQVTSHFGWRPVAVADSGGDAGGNDGGEAGGGDGEGGYELHEGIDIGAPLGTPVVAALGGAVTAVEPRGDYGTVVEIDHGQELTTVYAHLADPEVAAGDEVRAGQIIARVGESGRTGGPHLHFELRYGGVAIDPAPWLGLEREGA